MHRTWFSLWTLLSLLVNLLAPLGVSAAPLSRTEYAIQNPSLLPAWFTPDSARASGPAEALPAWFTHRPPTTDDGRQTTDDRPRTTEGGRRTTDDGPQTADLASRTGGLLPAWFLSGPSRNTEDGTLNSDAPHHTIYNVTVTGPGGSINNCDVVTFTIVATNDPVTTTNVIITSTMPTGFEPTQIVFNVGTVGPNETITRHAVFSATCSAVSGQNVVTLTQDGYGPIVRHTDFVVNPGAITVRKEPAVIKAAPDEVVTWTVYVENTGYGNVYNVRVTDTLGSGLQYISGLTSAYVISIPVGGVVTFPISARVVGCSGLENVVTATWGCNGQACLTPQTAKGAVDLAMINPDLDFSLPSFDVPYCAGSGVFTISITNHGDGTAYSGTLTVDLSSFSVDVAPPASYDGSAFHLPPIPPHDTYNLVFTLTLPSAVCAMSRSGTFNFDLTYYDRCGNLYTELPQSASWQLVNAPGQLSVSKSMPGEVYRGETVTATVTVNASGISGTVIVTDQVPAGWSVVNAAGGNVFTVGGVTYITWTLTGTATLNPVFATPGVDGCAYCGTAATNVVTATAVDCQNCRQTATDQATTYLQCEEPVATTFKAVSGPAETCSDPAFTYTNTYAFANSFIVTPTWQGMIFTETLLNQTYVPNSASVWMSDGSVTCTAVFSADVVGGMLVISNISPTCPITVPGATMWISYTTAVTEPAACSDSEWYDWSYLNLGVTGNPECAADGVIEEGVFVQTLAPAMSLDLSGLPSNVSSCGVYTVTLTAQRTSSVPAYDAVIDVPTSTFYVLDVLGFSGATPVYTETDSGGYHWYYSDTFATATTGTVQLRVQLRCGSGTAPFQGTLYYDNRCADNNTYRERCSTGGTLGSPPVIQPLPIMTKFPEVIYAHGDVVTWTLIAYNSGAGPAYSVVLTDLLGSDLRYVNSSITSTQGSVAGVTPITSSNLVTWVLPVIQPKERVTIQYVAEIIGCDDLTNRFAGAQGCLGQTCQSGGPVQSRVELPPAILLNTNQAVTPIDTCYTRTVTVTVRNAGLLSVYSATLTETLPVGLQYVTNTTEVSTDTVHWQPGPDPTINGQYLHWGPGSGSPLDALLSRIRPGETVYLRYNVYASCPFVGGQLRIQTGYRDTCGNPYLTEASYFLMPVRQSDLTLIKSGQNLSRTSPSPGMIYAEPGEPVVFTLTLTNDSAAAPAHEVVVTDTLPDNVVFWGASPGYTGPAPGSLGGVVTWTFGVISPATTVVLTITTVVSQPEGCTVADTQNFAEVAWGCPDGCRQGVRTALVTLRTRPVYDEPLIRTDIPPATLHQCGGLITVTLDNQGPPAYNVTLTDTLPSGYVFSGTVWASTPPSGTVDLGQTVVYTWGVLPTGLTTIVLAVRNNVGAGDCALPSGSNIITLTYDDNVPDCTTTGPYSVTAVQAINVVRPNLVVDKSPATLTAQVGQRVTWTLRITNTGSGIAYNVVVTDVVGTSFTDVTATNGSDGSSPVVVGNEVTWMPAPIAANGGIWTAQVSAVLTETGVNRNIVTATASCDTGCLATTASDISYVTLQQAFDKGPAIQTGTIGSLVVFTFTATLPDVENIYENLTLTDTLPTGLGYVGSVLTYTWDTDGGQGGPVTITTTTPTSAPAYLASGNVVWALGNLTGAVQIDGVITAVIQNIPSNYDGVRRTNVLTLTYTDDGQPYIYTDTANVDIVEPRLLVDKSVESSTGSLTDLDGTALLTYTIRLTNTGTSPAYSVHITDAVPAGISVTALYGGDSRSAPVVGPGTLTWTVNSISNVAPANVVLLTYTARISQGLVNAWLTNTVDILYHSLTETIPGVRPYTNTDQASVETAQPTVSKATEPFLLRVGDIVTYHVVFTVPAGTVWQGHTLVDGLTPGLWYITDSETLVWTPSTVNVTITSRVSNTTEAPGSQVIRWTFAPITSEQDIPTVVTLTFQAQAVGLRIDTLEPVWITQTERFWPGNYVQLEFPWPDVVTDVVTNMLIQPYLTISKDSTPPPGSYVGAGDRITYTLTVTNSGYGLAYDIVISDVLPAELFYVTSTITSTAPPYIAFLAGPPVGATGVLTWRVNELWGLEWSPWGAPKVAVITVVAQVTDTVGANLILTNTAAIPYYDSQPGDGPGPYTPDEREYTDGSDSVSHRTVDAAILKTVTPPTATLGDVITYVVVVPATPITATLYNVTVTDRLDPRLQLATVTDGPDGTVVIAGNSFTVTYASIPHGQQRFITVTAVLSSPLGAVAGQIITNLAVLRHQDGGPTPSNQPVFTVTEPALTLVKASDPPTSSTVRVGELVTYTVRITNATGVTRSPACDIVFTDTLPLGMRATPPALIAVTLNGAPVAAADYATGYNPASGVFTVAFTPAFSIPVGGELVIQYVARVDSDAPAATSLTNRAEATWSSLPGPVPGDRDYGPITDTTTLHTPLAVGLSKSVAPPTVTVGSQVVFSVTLPVPPVGAVLHNVVFTDVVDSRLRIDAVSPNAAFSGQVVTATFTTIPTYTQVTVIITATVRDLVTVTAGTQITDVAVFDYRDNPSGPIPSNPVTVTVAEPRVTLDKSVQVPRDPLGAGDLVTYALVLSNTGTWPAYDLVVTDSLPAGLAFVATVGFTVTDPVTATLGGDYPAWTVSQLNVGGYVYITFTAQVAWDIGAGLTLTNSAWGAYDNWPGEPPDERDYDIPTDTVPVRTGYPALDIEKSAEPSPVEAGGLLTYTLTVTNTGIVSATGVVVTDAVPANTTYLSCGPAPCGEAGGVVSWTLGTLDIGIPRVLTMLVRVDSPLPNGTVLTNTAWVTSTEGLTDTDTVTTPVSSAPVLNLVKSSTDANGGDLRPGDRITYTLVVSNTGNETALGVTVRDTVPAHTTYVSGSIAGGDSRDDSGLPVLVWSIHSLPPGVPIYLTFAVTVNLPLTDGLPIVNTGAVTSTQVPTPTTDTVTDTVTSSHALVVVKSASPSLVQAGDLLTYTLAYTITGDEPVYGVVVSDTVPENTAFVTATVPHILVGSTVLWPLGDFLPPESGITQATGVLTLVVQVASPLVSGTVLYNAVVITDTSGLTDTDTVTTPVESAHSLSVTKTASPSPVQAGDLLTYTIAWAVTGNEPAFGVTISDTVPQSTTYQACSGGLWCGLEPSGLVTWYLNTVNPPASGVVTLVVRVDSPLVSGTLIYNAVAITDTSGLTDTDEVTTPVESSHSLSITKAASPSPVQAGGLLTYTLAWAVGGNEPAFGVTISDAVPVSTTYVACYPAAICSESAGVVTWALGDQYPPASGMVTMVVRVDSGVPAGAFIYNAVVITDTSGLTDTDEITTPVQTRADLAVTKSDNPDPVIVGTLLTYTLVVTNHGPSVARNVRVTDTLPPEVAFVSATPAPTSGPNPLVWSLGDLAVSEVRRLTVTVRVLVTTTAVFTNAVIVNSNTPDDNPGNNQDDELTTPLVPGLELTKDVAPGQAVRNMPFTYTIRITNTGQVTFDPLVLTDTLPADFHYVRGSGDPSDPDVIAEPLLVWWNLGPLAPGESITVTFAVTATPGITGTYWNVALVGGEYPGGVLTDTDDAPVAIEDPTIALDKQLVAADLDEVLPNYVTFTIVITNIGISTIDVLPLLDAYDPYYLSFFWAEPMPDEPADDGLLTWYDLTGPAPYGFGRDLAPGESFRITTVFRVVHDITTTVNTAYVEGPYDVYDNPANEPRDDEPIVNIPTAVELLYFRVGGTAGLQVRLEWATAVEIDTFGFRLYRAPVADFARAQAVAFVPSEARGGGATYVYTDTVPYDGTWWYWLADVDTSGGETVHGPVRAVVGTAALPYRVYLPLVLRGGP